jgi:DNA-binding transcriptional regulator YiaG
MIYVKAIQAGFDMGSQMPLKSKKMKVPTKKSRLRAVAIRGLHGVRVVTIKGETKLELRYRLGMPREVFGRLVNVSVRTIAAVESSKKKAEKLQRNYVEVKRLCDSLSEVVDPEFLGEWFNTPNDAFGGLKPIEVIERGEIDQLWEMFYRLRSGIPS